MDCLPKEDELRGSMEGNDRLMHTSAPMPVNSVSMMHGQQGAEMKQSEELDGRKQDIGDILQQIMSITDQSLDEAQAK